MSKVVCLFSGGLDSTTLAYLMAQKSEVHLLSVHYGQRHAVELERATKIANYLGAPHTTVNLSNLTAVLQGSSQTDPSVPVPHGHYEDESMKATVVPNRNMILLSVAFAHAISVGADRVAYGAHAGDHAVYPDCRKVFVDQMAQAALLCHYTPITLVAPYVNSSKTDVARDAATLHVPVELTWSCYDPQALWLDQRDLSNAGHHKDPLAHFDPYGPRGAGWYKWVHCGKCGTCVERMEALRDGYGKPDPTAYA